jgi:hypothetical protein
MVTSAMQNLDSIQQPGDFLHPGEIDPCER